MLKSFLQILGFVFLTFFTTSPIWTLEASPETKLIIKTRPPGAKIQLDYQNVGTTPLTLENIKPGSHFLTLIMYGYRRTEKNITVEAGKENKIEEELMALVGSLAVKTKPPGASVLFDDSEYLGQTPLQKPAIVIGQHTIKVSLPGYAEVTRKFKIKYGEEKKFIIALNPEPGKLSISTTPPGATIYINGKKRGKSNTTIELAGGNYELKVKRNEYKTITQQVKVEPGQTNHLNLTLVGTVQTKLSIKTKPSQSNIFLDGEEIGRTPFVVKKIEPGIHFLVLTKEGHQDVEKKIFIKKNETTKILEVLELKVGKLSITVTPSEANIYLDNKYLGTSPVSVAKLATGAHKLRISHPKYEDYLEDFILANDEYKTVTVTLQPITGKLDLTATKKGASVFVDGKKKGTTPLTVLLKPGSHDIQVQIPGYKKHEQKITVKSGETLKIYASLEKIMAGSLVVTTKPEGAQVFVDSQPIGKTPVTISPLEAKKHNIILSLLGYETITDTVEVKDEKTMEFHRELKIKSGILKLSTDPSNAKVEIDNVVVGHTPIEINVPTGSHLLKVSRKNYQDWVSTFVIDHQEEKEIGHTLEAIPGMLVITTDPMESDVTINGELQASKSISLKPGHYEVRVSHEGYLPQKKTVKIGLNETVEISVKLEEIFEGALLVSTIPPGADIYINGELKGKSPANFLKIPAGKYQIRITKEGYKPIEKMVTIFKNQGTDITEELAAQTGTLFVKAFPTESEIHLDNKYLGTSPQLVRNLVIGKHEVRIAHEDYSDFTEEVQIEPNSQSRLNVNLEQLPGEVFVFSNPSEGDIYINGKFKGKTNTLIKLKPGDYRIQVTKTGYYGYYKDVTIPSGRQISLDFHLMEQGSGSLLITTTPPGAQVFLNGEFFGQTPLERKYLKAASHSLLIIKDGYKSLTDNISIAKGENLKLNFKLSSVWGTLKVLTKPDQTTIYLDGEFLGHGPGVFRNIPVGWHRIKVIHKNYREWTGKLNLKSEEEKEIQIKLEPLSADVSLRSKPPEASVYIKGKNVGQTPLKVPLVPGPYSIRFEKKGYLDKNLPLELSAGSKQEFEVTLTKKKILRVKETKFPSAKESIITAAVKKKTFSETTPEKIPAISFGSETDLKGSLMIKTNPPGAKVYLDYEPFGKSPLIIDDIKAGDHFLTVSLDKYREIERNIQVPANQVKIIDEELSALIGSVFIQSDPPDADIYINNRDYLGKTPLLKQDFLVGWHQLTLKKEGYLDFKDEFKLKYGQEKTIKAKLQAKPGRLIVNSNPNGALVIVDGKNLGQSPLNQQFPPGSYQIQITKEEHKKYEHEFIITSDQDTFLDITLESTHNEADGMIFIPAGEFIQGNDEGDESEKPARKVWIDAFFISKYEVTNRQYRNFVRATNHRAPVFMYQKNLGHDNQPVVGISWHDAVAYAKWAGKRLPTEAEWEKAARGLHGRNYPWGSVWDKNKANSAESKMTKPAPVGSFPEGISPFGLMDMAGNVWEWTADWFVSNYYAFAPYKNPKGARFGTTRTTRGGSWVDEPEALRTTIRKGVLPTLRTSNIGFRCAMDY